MAEEEDVPLFGPVVAARFVGNVASLSVIGQALAASPSEQPLGQLVRGPASLARGRSVGNLWSDRVEARDGPDGPEDDQEPPVAAPALQERRRGVTPSRRRVQEHGGQRAVSFSTGTAGVDGSFPGDDSMELDKSLLEATGSPVDVPMQSPSPIAEYLVSCRSRTRWWRPSCRACNASSVCHHPPLVAKTLLV